MEYTKIYTGEDQKSHFQNEEYPLKNSKIGDITDLISAKNVYFGELDQIREISWHNPKCRQFVIMLEGSMEIEIGDGSKRTFHVGDVVLAEDTTGQGHITRAASEGIRKYMIIELQ